MKITKLKQLAIAAAVGTQITLPMFAAEGAATGTKGKTSLVIPAIAADDAGGSPAQEAEIKALKQQVEALVQKVNALEQQHPSAESAATVSDLDQQVRILQRQREIDQDAAAAKAATAPKITLGQNGFSFSSADTNFVLQIHSVLQLDSRTFFHDNNAKGVDGFLLRRARPILSGTVYRDFDYMFVPDFGGSTVQIFDAYLVYRYSPEFQVQAGKFKSPVGLEALQADANIQFNERSLATDLVPNRDLGLALKGDLYGGAASYTVGIFNGASDYNGTTTNQFSQNNKAVVSRVIFQPWKNSDLNALRGFGFGVGGSYENDNPATNATTSLTPGYTTDGQQKFFTYNKNVFANGVHWRVSPQAYYYYGPFGLLGEYVISDQRVSNDSTGGSKNVDVQNHAWEVAGSWLLTGEEASYNGITPRQNFDPRLNQWGAWQVVARYAELNVDSDVFKGSSVNTSLANPNVSADSAQAWAVGLNWYLNKNIRADLSFSHTTFGGYTGPKTGVAAQSENVLFTRIQLAF
jgi:phosphate-selective porin OprO/OprP